MTAETSGSGSDFLELEFDLPHAREKVWLALTDPALLREWLLPAFDFKLEPGAKFLLKSQPMPGWDGTVNCQMREIVPFEKLSYAWVVGDIDTVVSFTLTPTEGGTRLGVLHSGFRLDQKKNKGGAQYGWKMMGAKLVTLLETLT